MRANPTKACTTENPARGIRLRFQRTEVILRCAFRLCNTVCRLSCPPYKTITSQHLLFLERIGGQYLASIGPASAKPYSQVADSDARDVDLGGWGNRYYGKR